MTDNFRTEKTRPAGGPLSSGTGSASPSDEERLDAQLRAVHEEIVQVAHSASAIDIRSYEAQSGAEIHAGLAPLTVSHISKALELTRQLFFLCDQWEQKTATGAGGSSREEFSRDFDFEIDKLVHDPIENQSPRDNVADLAFIAKSELKDRQLRLQTLNEDEEPWNLLAEYDSALRRIRKSLTAVDYVLCKSESLPQCLDFQTELEVSLSVRRAYTRLRRSVTGSQSPNDETIYARLRAAGTQLAVLVGREVYPHLRIRDRAQLREMQNRILEWMRSERENSRAGMRIWQDIVGVIDIFCQVSRRQELVEHDSKIVEQVHKALEAPSGPLHEETVALLMSLEGLDLEVDGLLASEQQANPKVWHEPIARLMTHFGRAISESEVILDISVDEDFF